MDVGPSFYRAALHKEDKSLVPLGFRKPKYCMYGGNPCIYVIFIRNELCGRLEDVEVYLNRKQLDMEVQSIKRISRLASKIIFTQFWAVRRFKLVN